MIKCKKQALRAFSMVMQFKDEYCIYEKPIVVVHNIKLLLTLQIIQWMEKLIALWPSFNNM